LLLHTRERERRRIILAELAALSTAVNEATQHIASTAARGGRQGTEYDLPPARWC
jgi:hypothetical protein